MNVADWKKAPNHPVKVIQFGEGNFLRGFVDWMIHKMNEQNLFSGSVAVVQPLASGLLPILESQNYIYTHYLKGIKDQEPVIEYYKNTALSVGINPYEDFESYLALAHIETASIIVSNTTEAGIVFDPTDQLDKDALVTYPGKLTRLMYERYETFKGDPQKGYIVLPCELIDNNADRLKEAVLAYIDLWNLGETFKTWVDKSNQFCNTLVDRIVPGYPKETIKTIWEELGYEDQLVVESEQFNLWVIQGDEKVQQAFPADEAGCQVLFVEDVTPYKIRKVRILNGAHTTLVPIAYLYGIETVLESVEDLQINQFLMKAIFEEIIPTLTLSKEALEIYAGEVILRFKNPFVKHYLMSISLNSMSKYQTRVLPSLLAYFDQNSKLPKRLVAALAAYMVFYRGEYAGKKIDVVDSEDILKLYEDAWKQYDGSKASLDGVVEAILGYESNWKGNLNHIPGLRDQVVHYVTIIFDEGMENLINVIEEED